MQTEAIAQLLADRGVKPSLQRVKMYQYMEKVRKHQNADEIYQALKNDMPTLSKTTVYNTMDTFVAHGLVNKLVIDAGEARYDVDTYQHGHFKCRQCGSIQDVAMKEPELLESNGAFQVEKMAVYYTGLCSTCLEENTNNIS